MMRQRIKRVCLLTACIVLLSMLGGCAGKDTLETETLVIYTQHPTEFIIPIVREFENRTGIDVEVVQGGTGTLMERIQNETEAPYGDILWGGSLYTIEPYADLFETYQTVNEGEVREDFRNEEGNLTRFTDVPSVIMVNTDLLGKRRIKGYKDLLKSEFEGKIALANPNTSSSSLEQLINMLYACQEADGTLGWDYVEQLCRQLDGNLLSSSSEVYNGVANGEYVIGLTFEEAAAELRGEGKHVGIIYMDEGVISTPDLVCLIQNSPHRRQAEAFLDFVTGYDAQYMIACQLHRRSVRVDVPTPPNLATEDSFSSIMPDASEVEQHREDWLEQFNQIWEKCAHE